MDEPRIVAKGSSYFYYLSYYSSPKTASYWSGAMTDGVLTPSSGETTQTSWAIDCQTDLITLITPSKRREAVPVIRHLSS